MRLCSPHVFLALCLLTLSSVARAQPGPCQAEVRRIELVKGSAPPSELCIGPGLSTTVFFDTALAPDAVELEGRERFRRVEVAGSLLVLVPSERIRPGERLRLTVRFAEAEPSEEVSFVLRVHRDQADRQVEVARARPPADTCQAELQRKEEELQRCLGRHPPPPERARPVSLAGVFAAGLMDSGGIAILSLEAKDLAHSSEDALEVMGVKLYRSLSRLTVEVLLRNTDRTRPWVLAGAQLQGRSGDGQSALSVEQSSPLEPGARASVWVELAFPLEIAHKTYTLKLWDASNERTLTLHGLRSP